MSEYDNVFEPSSELFGLVARLGMRDLEILERKSNSEGIMSAVVYVKLFTLLLRADAESMPKNDPDITAWATYLCMHQSNNNFGHKDFAQWVLDWSSRARNSDPVLRAGMRMGGSALVRRQLFWGGSIARKIIWDEIARRFVEICGGRVEFLAHEVERVGRARVCQDVGDGGAHA